MIIYKDQTRKTDTHNTEHQIEIPADLKLKSRIDEKRKENYDTLNKSVFMVQVDTP